MADDDHYADFYTLKWGTVAVLGSVLPLFIFISKHISIIVCLSLWIMLYPFVGCSVLNVVLNEMVL